MTSNLEVLFTPAEFATLKGRDLSQTVCVVIDALRATSSMLTAFANGATLIFPVKEIAEAIELKASRPEALLAGERDGVEGEESGELVAGEAGEAFGGRGDALVADE